MSLTLIALGVGIALLAAWWAPETARRVFDVLWRLKRVGGAIIGVAIVLFLLRSGVTMLAAIGVVLVVTWVWWVLFRTDAGSAAGV